MPTFAIFIGFIPLWEVRWDRTTVPGFVVHLDRWSVVVGGMRRVPTVGLVGLDRVSFAGFSPARPTSLPDGSYYVPPPHEVATVEGWPLERLWAFPTTVV